MTRWLADFGRTIFVLLLVGALVAPAVTSVAETLPAAAATAPASPLVSIQEENLLVLEVRIDKRSTGHGLIAFQHEDATLMPLGELCAILELAVVVDPDRGTAQGWIVEEGRTFSLNLASQTVTMNGNIMPLPPGSVGRDRSDIYVLSTVLEQWLPVDLTVNLSRMNVVIIPRETLPFQSRLKRDEQRSLWLANQGKGVRSYPLQMAPYRLWSWPLVDATLGVNSGRQNNTRRLALEAYADLAGLASNLFVSHVGSEDHSQTIARFKAGRWNPEGRLLGPAAATHYEFGDLFISRVPLISVSRQGLGASISNQSLARSREFNTTQIQGDAPPGWEAELYINGSLYDFQIIGETGQYLFNDVPLIVGDNTFRTVLRGPRGETREVVKSANVSAEMSDIGQLKYRATVVRDGEGLLYSPPTRPNMPPSTWNTQLELGYTLDPQHALVANYSRLSGIVGSENFVSLTSHNSFGHLYLETILAGSPEGGRAVSLGARTKLGGQNLFALYNVNDDYRAETLNGRSYMSREAILRSSGSLAELGDRSLYYNLSATNRRYADSDLLEDNELKFHLSTSIKRYQLAHSLSFRHRATLQFVDDMTQGTQLVRTQLGPVSVGGDLNYELAPAKLWSIGASINWFRTEQLQVSARTAHFISPGYGNDNVSADVTFFFEKLSLGINGSYFKAGGPAIGVTLGTFLTRDNRSNSWMVHHQRMASRSVASVRAFIDINGNKVFDEGDEPLPGVGFLNHTAWRKVRTNKDGIALLTGLQVNRTQTIELNAETVADPFLVPLSKGVNVLGHPGSFVDVEFPFSYVGEVEGMVAEAGDMQAPVRHVGIEVLDRDGNRVQSAVAEFDGYYYFSNLLPGEYHLAVVASTVNTSRYLLPEPVPFTVPPEGGFVEGPDVLLERAPITDKDMPLLADLMPVVPGDVPVEVPSVAIDATPEKGSETAREKAPEKAPSATPDVAVDQPATEVAVTPPVVASKQTPPVVTEEHQDLAAGPQAQAAGPQSQVTGPQAEAGPTRDSSLQSEPAIPTADVPVAVLAAAPDFDEELTLSLIFEMLYRNSLWPDEPIQ